MTASPPYSEKDNLESWALLLDHDEEADQLTAFTQYSRTRLRQFHPAKLKRFSIPKSLIHCVGKLISFAVCAFLLASAYLAIFVPLYVSPPKHYQDLTVKISASTDLGRGNVHHQKVFIAANILDASLVAGPWGQSVLELVDILGPQNVFVSVFQNDGSSRVAQELEAFSHKLNCRTSIATRLIVGNKSIIADDHVDIDTLPHTRLPSGQYALGRIVYLAHVRNRALRPLDEPEDNNFSNFTYVDWHMRFDKLLFLNDVYFNPVDAAQLLFSTNRSPGALDGQAPSYDAACAVDTMSVTNFYDDFATRDDDGRRLGYGPGFRIFPWFATASASRADVLDGKDAVRVQSCWGGMVAFDASHFQHDKRPPRRLSESRRRRTTIGENSMISLPESRESREPLRFRASTEPFWLASECCLLQADLAKRITTAGRTPRIFVNPYIRVAYAPKTFAWIPFMLKIEHGLAPLQAILTWVFRYPVNTERGLEIDGQHASRRVWTYASSHDIGALQEQSIDVTDAGGFCGERRGEYMFTDFRQRNIAGERNYYRLDAPF